MPLQDPNLEGFAIVDAFMKRFWDDKQHLFLARGGGGGYDGDGHLTLWPVAVAAQAVVDAARVNPQFKPLLGPVMDTFRRYYSPKHHAYCASLYFDGNEDIYYDDNAQVASAFLTAYEATQEKDFLDKGVENVNFLMTGKDGGKFGGVRWHIGKEGANTCTTAEVGIACARTARFLQDGRIYVDFAKYCYDFIFEKLQDTDDKLICDGLEPDGDSFKRNTTKWTYNQGTPLSLCGLLFELTKEDKYFESAHTLAAAVSDTNTEIFDRDTPDHDKRYYRDSTAFLQLLIEGYADYLLFFGDRDTKLSEHIVQLVNRQLYYIYSFMKLTPGSPEYVGTLELYRIDEARYEVFQKMLGENKEYQPSEGERKDNNKKGALTPNLMNQGAAARVFFQAARVVPKVEF